MIGRGQRSGPSSDELAEIKRLKKENAELHEANDLLKAASVLFVSQLAPSPPLIDGFIDEQRAAGREVESICAVLRQHGVPVALRTYRRRGGTRSRHGS